MILWKSISILKYQFKEQDKGFIQRAWLSMNLQDRLTLLETPEAKQVLVDVYQELGLCTSAYALFLELVDKSDHKQVKNFYLRKDGV